MERLSSVESLIDSADVVATEALDILFTMEPGLKASYDARRLRLAHEDMAHHLRQLAAIALNKDGSALVDYLSWLKVLFDGLKLPDRLVSLSFRCAGQAAARFLGPAEGPGFQALADRAAREYGRSEPVGNRYLKEGLPDNTTARALVQALISGRRDLAEGLLHSELGKGTGVRRLYLELFQPSLREIGRLWHQRQISVAQEHFSTAAMQYLMSGLYPLLFSASRPNGKRLTAACAQGELHEIGLRMVADFFQAEGWDVRFLGANLPFASLIEELRASPPDLVALSATITSNVRWIATAIAAIREGFGPSLTVLVGGIPFMVSPGLWKEVGADATALDCEQAAIEGGRLVGLASRSDGAEAAP